MFRKTILPIYVFSISILSIGILEAKVTFLPDYNEEHVLDGGEAKNYCERSKDPVYHYAPNKPQCPAPKIFDHTCPHDENWISACYCPASYNKTCTSPYRGVGLVCDGKYEDCCDTRCPGGSQSSSCSYPYVSDGTTSTGCGDTCYYCRYGNDCNTSCGYGEVETSTGGYNDFNGQACVSCSTPAPEPTPDPDPTPTPDPDPTPTPDPDPTPTPDPDPTPTPDPCAGKTSKSCPYGCASYDSKCSGICISCKSNPDCNVTSKSCPNGCASTNSCGKCTACKEVSCPKGVSCPNGCLSYLPIPQGCPNACATCKSSSSSSSGGSRPGQGWGGCAGTNCESNNLEFANSNDLEL